MKITKIHAREVIDSRGNPTVEVDVTLDNGSIGRAIVPSGASTGEREALELRDGDKKRFMGKGVLTAVKNINEKIAPKIIGKEVYNQKEIDETMISMDNTENKANLGANAILGVSMAVAVAGANSKKQPLYAYLNELAGSVISGWKPELKMPVPLMNIINGGAHADSGLDIQEFMIVPSGFTNFNDALRCGVEVFHNLKKVLASKKYSTSVGDEGGFAPNLKNHEEALSCIAEATKMAGYELGKHVLLALDCAASEFRTENGNYKFEGKEISPKEMIAVYKNYCEKYPVLSIEDGLSENDWEGWSELTKTLGEKVQLVGDDLFVTNVSIFSKGIEKKIGNSILIKVNQIGSITETLRAVKMAYDNNYTAIMSHRSGETEDSFIADFSVALGTGFIKTGSASRSDRMAKYNQLLRIAEHLGKDAKYPGEKAFTSIKR